MSKFIRLETASGCEIVFNLDHVASIDVDGLTLYGDTIASDDSYRVTTESLDRLLKAVGCDE
jgi:hypothetical protein